VIPGEVESGNVTEKVVTSSCWSTACAPLLNGDVPVSLSDTCASTIVFRVTMFVRDHERLHDAGEIRAQVASLLGAKVTWSARPASARAPKLEMKTPTFPLPYSRAACWYSVVTD
jgi:hypothetical protein